MKRPIRVLVAKPGLDGHDVGAKLVCRALRDAGMEVLYTGLRQSPQANQIEVRKLGWGTRRSWSRIGHYDPVHHSITISPVLDSPEVPEMVISYLLYHEMLHALFAGWETAGKARRHSAAFRRAENAFPLAAEAKRFLDRFCRRQPLERRAIEPLKSICVARHTYATASFSWRREGCHEWH